MQTTQTQPSPAAAPHRSPGRPAQQRRQAARRARAEARMRVIVARGDLLHAVHVGPRLILAIGLLLVALVGGSAGAVYYFTREEPKIFSEADATKLRQQMEAVIWQQREAELKATLSGAYESKLADLKSEMDRLTEKQKLEKSSVEQQVDQVLDRQQQLSKRQELLARIADAAKRAGFDVKVPAIPPAPKKTGGKLADKTNGPRASADTVAQPQVQLASVTGAGSAAGAARMAKITTEVDRMERAQEALVFGLTRSVSARTNRIAAILQKVGARAPGAKRNADADAMGGPFVPLPDDPSPARFALGVQTLGSELDRLAATRRVALSLPWGAPLGNAPISSGFGARTDPFLGRPAMHTGVDFRAPMGYPAPAALGGTVISAGWEGGYGNMVDVDAGNGIVTRYGHLSAIKVKVGETVKTGQIIGRVGSTGRSTGTHLHYEIRVNGRPIDPMTYIVPGREMAALL